MFVIVMGVSASGKTTVGAALAQVLGWPFYDGDDFHPPASIAKMAAGAPLDDGDRSGWLASLAEIIRRSMECGESAVMACSALKPAYRARLQAAASHSEQVKFVYLKGDMETILKRMQGRQGHYMQANMLQSQFDDLDEPTDAITIDLALSVSDEVRQIMEQLAIETAATLSKM